MKLRLIDPPRHDAARPGRSGLGYDYEPGDCWYAAAGPGGDWCVWPDAPEGRGRYSLSPEIAAGGDPPEILVLPNGALFCLRWEASSGGRWQVSGRLPDVTVSPSIWYDPGGDREWHGHIRAGELVG